MSASDPTLRGEAASRSTLRAIGHRLDRVIAVVSGIGAVGAAAAAVLMIVLITVEVVARSIFTFSTLLADEFSGYLLVAMTFLGLAYTSRFGAHVRVDSAIRFLPPRPRGWVVTAGLVLSLFFILLLTWQAFGLVWSSYDSQERAITVRRTPLWIPQLVIPLGLVLFALVIVREIVWRLAGGREDEATTADSEFSQLD